MKSKCQVESCLRDSVARGYCGRHYQRWSKYGDPLYTKCLIVDGDSVAARFWMRAAVTANPERCWIWLGGSGSKGYGTVQHEGRIQKTHRVSYKIFYNDDPGTLHVLHDCDNTSCVNPHHLYKGTNDDNVRDKIERNRCKAPVGSAHLNAKLTEETALDVKRRIRNGERQADIARLYGVAPCSIWCLKTGRTWSHVKLFEENEV